MNDKYGRGVGTWSLCHVCHDCTVALRRFVTYLALATIAVSQPLLDLYGTNLTVFSAAKVGRLEIGVFIILVMLVPALLATAVDRFSTRFGPVVHRSVEMTIVFLFLFVFALVLLRWLKVERDYLVYPSSLVVAFLLTRFYAARASLRQWVSWLSIVAVAVLATFVLQAQPILFPSATTFAEASVGRTDIPVFMVVMDEAPLYALLGTDGRINADRFPNFAELARQSTWYRDNTAISNFTHQAVPGIMASKIPEKDDSPFLALHPKNIFTLLGDKIDVDATEPVTSLCPTNVCSNTEQATGFSGSRLWSFLKDALVVYGQRTLPYYSRRGLPDTEHGWGGFGAVESRFVEQLKTGALGQANAIVEGARDLVDATKGGTGALRLVHALVPHAPWYMTPDQRITSIPVYSTTSNPAIGDGTRDNYQRFLHQFIGTDRAIGDAITVLKDAGIWDKTLVVITADHGISFVPGKQQRNVVLKDRDRVLDIYKVPTFVKYPNQKSGEISDCASSNLDLLPTVIDVLQVETTWEFQGESLVNGCPQREKRPIETATGKRGSVAETFADLQRRVSYYDAVVRADGGVDTVAAVGASAELIGQRLDVNVATDKVLKWTVSRPEDFLNLTTEPGSRVAVTINGGIVSAAFEPGTEGILLIDGVAAGVVGELSGAEGIYGYTAVIDSTLMTAGDHVVELVIRAPDGTLTSAGPPSS
jgi:Sulfatase